MQAFQLNLRPSCAAKQITAAAHLAGAILCWRYFEGTVQWAGLAALLSSLITAWRHHSRRSPDSWQKITIDTAGNARISRTNGEECDAVLLGNSLIHRRACFLCFQHEKGRNWLTVLPDMTDAESYRRLMVWARFGRPKSDKNRQEV